MIGVAVKMGDGDDQDSIVIRPVDQAVGESLGPTPAGVFA